MTAPTSLPRIEAVPSSRCTAPGTDRSAPVIRSSGSCLAMRGNRHEVEDFMTGFVLSDREVWGRPVGVAVAQDGTLFVTEDGNGSIWRISPRGTTRAAPRAGEEPPIHYQNNSVCPKDG